MNQHDNKLDDESWECPTCLRPMEPEHDYECGCCEAKASEHLRVTTLCRILRETQRRESSLIVENAKLKANTISLEEAANDQECELAAWELLQDAKTSVEHWKQKATQAEQAANDLVAELMDTRREWKEELAAERALADRLASEVEDYILCQADLGQSMAALAAWKEARNQ